MRKTILLLSALGVLVIFNCADACVDIYRVDKYGERHFVRTEYCHKEDCPYFQTWSNAKIQTVYEHDIAPAKKEDRSKTADLDISKQQVKKKTSIGRKISNGFRSIFGRKKK